MSNIVQFYEKPGCIGNGKQKEQLRKAGYILEVIDMIGCSWKASELAKFFGGTPIHQCVNPRAPRIVSGEVSPDALSDQQLMDAMIADPMLIRRPLIAVGEERGVGFKNALVTRLLGGEQDEAKCGRADEAVNCEPGK